LFALPLPPLSFSVAAVAVVAELPKQAEKWPKGVAGIVLLQWQVT
jgi:hypothetical protein